MKTMATLFLLLAVSAAAMGQSGDADKSKIVALENAWNLAEQHKDVKALDEMRGSNLVYVDYDGTAQNQRAIPGQCAQAVAASGTDRE
jgi:hypothetical protein